MAKVLLMCVCVCVCVCMLIVTYGGLAIVNVTCGHVGPVWPVVTRNICYVMLCYVKNVIIV